MAKIPATSTSSCTGRPGRAVCEVALVHMAAWLRLKLL